MAPGTRRNGKIDAQVEETFPASDPPSFMGGEALGAPPGRYTPRRMSSTIKQAKRKAKTSARKKRAVKEKPAAKKRKAATKKRKSR